MPNEIGQAYALSVITPIAHGEEDALRAHLEGLPVGPESPLARLPGVHFARWVIIHELFHQGPPQRPDRLASQYLMFTVDFDGSLDAFLEALRTRMGDAADAIWGRCVGYPGAADAAGFVRYLRHNQLDTLFAFAAYPDATVAQVRAALELRAELIAFALEAQHLEAAELREGWDRRFGPAGTRPRELELR